MNANRREFLQATAAAATAVAVFSEARGAASAVEPLVDTNVSLGSWPFRRLETMQADVLAKKLRDHGVTQAWAGSFEALLHKDVSAVNARLADECRRHGDLFTPIGALNPRLPGWEEDLRRCAEVHRMPGIRLHPNYHGYPLSDDVFERVLQAAERQNMLVQIAVIMEEERTIHRLVNLPPTDVTPLAAAAKKFPQVRLQLLNAFRSIRPPQAVALAEAGVSFEIATLEGVEGVGRLLEQLPLPHVCFGSYAPVFYFESATLKLQESVLAGMQRRAVASDNARRLLGSQ
jgi:predicted TIM-barrel fold metal-dependent hydrolase